MTPAVGMSFNGLQGVPSVWVWVDSDLGIALISQSCHASSAKFPSTEEESGRQRNIEC